MNITSPSMDNCVVKVELGMRSYDIHVGSGLLQNAGPLISQVAPKARLAIITDTNVAPLHLKTLTDSLDQQQINWLAIEIPAGEQSKSFDQFNVVIEQVLAARLERGDVIAALGGGVVGDLAGFVAGVVRRGMKFIQLPTSLLAQVDSSVGGKTGINSPHGKNLVGVFHQPELVLADTDVLDTLSKREFRAGYAEVAKYGLIDRPDFFEWLEKNWPEIERGGPARAEAIAESCRCKATVVAADEREHGCRALLNLGHTFGHALEAATGFDGKRLVHGEGVAIGMVLAHRFSNQLNLTGPEAAERVIRHLKTVGLPTSIAEIPGDLPPPEILLEHIMQDKKVTRGELNFILTRGIGQSFIADNVPVSQVQNFLEKEYSQ